MTSTILLRPRPYAQSAGSFFLVALLPPPKPVPSLPSEIWTAIFEFVAIQRGLQLWSLLRVCSLFKVRAHPIILPVSMNTQGNRTAPAVCARRDLKYPCFREVRSTAAFCGPAVGFHSSNPILDARQVGSDPGPVLRRIRWTSASARSRFAACEIISPGPFPRAILFEPFIHPQPASDGGSGAARGSR
jgi:hypothetical protein